MQPRMSDLSCRTPAGERPATVGSETDGEQAKMGAVGGIGKRRWAGTDRTGESAN
jgi:hypothetical protein